MYAAEIIGACNVFVNDNGVITGHVTDGVGFVKNLEVNGVDVKGKKTVDGAGFQNIGRIASSSPPGEPIQS